MSLGKLFREIAQEFQDQLEAYEKEMKKKEAAEKAKKAPAPTKAVAQNRPSFEGEPGEVISDPSSGESANFDWDRYIAEKRRRAMEKIHADRRSDRALEEDPEGPNGQARAPQRASALQVHRRAEDRRRPKSNQALRQALVWSEILGPPRSRK